METNNIDSINVIENFFEVNELDKINSLQHKALIQQNFTKIYNKFITIKNILLNFLSTKIKNYKNYEIFKIWITKLNAFIDYIKEIKDYNSINDISTTTTSFLNFIKDIEKSKTDDSKNFFLNNSQEILRQKLLKGEEASKSTNALNKLKKEEEINELKDKIKKYEEIEKKKKK